MRSALAKAEQRNDKDDGFGVWIAPPQISLPVMATAHVYDVESAIEDIAELVKRWTMVT